MRFELYSCKYFYHKKDDRRLVKQLRKYGFTFRASSTDGERLTTRRDGHCHIASLEDLFDLMKQFNCPLVIRKSKGRRYMEGRLYHGLIELYNDYRE